MSVQERMGRARRILVAMSGGVDSSVAAALLVERGHEVVGATMKTFCYSETPGASQTCCGLQGIADARRVADHLGIRHYVFDVEEEFTRDVIDDFVSEYARGRTPNPCVRCNSNTKFRDLLERGRVLGCDGVASGHYVRIRHPDPAASRRHHPAARAGAPPDAPDGTAPALLRGVDEAKDQAYFLWGLPREMLSRLHFPLGDLTKEEVRERARSLGLATAEKPESQEICFVPTGDYRDLLRDRLETAHPALERGPIVTSEGEVVGEHGGYAAFTVGQRRGLGGGFSEPMYVLEIRPERREVVVGTREELYAPAIEVGELNWLAAAPEPGERVDVQVRHGAPAAPARVVEAAPALRLELLRPQWAVSPGQSAVVFRNERVLGGGRIIRALRGAPAAPAAGGG